MTDPFYQPVVEILESTLTAHDRAVRRLRGRRAGEEQIAALRQADQLGRRLDLNTEK
jgi:hypothetical protein